MRIRGLTPFLLTVIVLGCVAGLFGFSASLNPVDVLLGRGRQIATPDFKGMPLPRAKVEAERAGLDYSVRSAFSLSVQRGSVIRQDPVAGTKIRAGETVQLTVSMGENSAPMPDAVGKPLNDVRGPLDDALIEVVVERIFSETVGDGIVMSQSPEAGVVLRGGESARFVVSRGAEKRPVPNVAGLKPTGAAYLIGKAGLQIGEVDLVEDDSAPIGSVISTTPATDTSVSKGARIDINVSAGPPVGTVPDVTGQSAKAATVALFEAGFRAEVASQVFASGDPSIAKVVTQNPAPGQEIRTNQPVTIVVGVGPPEPPPTTTTTTTTTTTLPESTTSTTSTTIRR